MTQTEYEQNRAECLIAFYEDQSLTPHSVCQALYYAFDRGYALGKVKDLISQDEIDKAAVIAAANYNNPFDEPAYDKRFYDGFKAGANFAIGKQENIKDIMHYLSDKGLVNVTHEQIDKK